MSTQMAGIGLEAEKGYWKRLEVVEVDLVAEKEGWFLQKYSLESNVSAASRRSIDNTILTCTPETWRWTPL